MAKRYCGTGERGKRKQREHAEHIDAPIARSLEVVIVMTNELEEKLAQIDGCPEPCDDGTVEITLASGQIKKMPCPVLASDCGYGEWMEQGLDRYLCGVMSGIGVPRRHLDKFTEAYKTEAVAEIEKWTTRGFLIFIGSTGSGKSFGAAMALRKYLKSIVPNRYDRMTWGTAGRAANSVMWCASSDIGEDRETAARAKREHLIVLDDIGGEADIPAGRNALSSVILRRHDMQLPTIITTTLTMLDIDIRYGGRVADRLTEDIGSGGMIIECGDVSLRNPAAFCAGLKQ